MSEQLPVAEVKQPVKRTVKETINSPEFQAEVARVLPKIVTPSRFMRVALTAMLKTPKLADCQIASVTEALLRCAQYGIEPDGRRAHLIPYGNVCTLIIDYKGLAELAIRSGIVANIHADVIRQGDLFEFDCGVVKRHVAWWLRNDKDKPLEAGEVIGAFAVCNFKDGTQKADAMPLSEIQAIQRRSRSGGSGPWVTDFNEMAKKTVFRRLSKWLPMSAEFRDAVELDNEDDDIKNVTPTPAQIELRPVFTLETEPQTEGGAA